ncbi:MAG: hypothetical protein AAGA60_10710 [Cyanobacteria bacterium P01_E01_bin.42]
MAFVARLSQMASRTIRRRTTGNSQGLRRLAPFGALTQTQGRNGQGILARVWGAIKGAAGFLWGAIKGLAWSATKVWGLIVQGWNFVVNFNWNVTTQEVNQSARQAWQQLAGKVGGFLGQAVGWLVCGAVPGMVVSTFSPALGAYILQEVGVEAFDELTSTFSQFISEEVKVWGGIITKYLWIFVRNSTEVFLGKDPRRERKPWSFASTYEERLENIDSPAMQNFVEEFVEELGDACIEAGYVVTGGIDQHAATMAAIQSQNQRGQQVVSVQF